MLVPLSSVVSRHIVKSGFGRAIFISVMTTSRLYKIVFIVCIKLYVNMPIDQVACSLQAIEYVNKSFYEYRSHPNIYYWILAPHFHRHTTNESHPIHAHFYDIRFLLINLRYHGKTHMRQTRCFAKYPIIWNIEIDLNGQCFQLHQIDGG